jgi:hypothetical protein
VDLPNTSVCVDIHLPPRSVACEFSTECRDGTVRRWNTLAACYVCMCY